MILEQIGEPPIPCLPIYIITCTDEKEETIVYIGKTKNDNRFTGGHTAALKLLSPEFENKKKKIYRCAIWFHFNDEYIVLDWIRPEELALEILDSIESQLIYHFKPMLNTNKKNKNFRKTPITPPFKRRFFPYFTKKIGCVKAVQKK